MNLRPARRLIGCGLVAAGLALLAACATQALNAARTDFYAGRFDAANRTLDRKIPTTDRVLFLMERGTIRLFLGDYTNSARDLIEAADEAEKLETYSVGRGSASMVVNDNVQAYRGFPYERTLLHSFAAKSHLARGDWESSAVESRRAIASLTPDIRRDYPDCAYARYLAGFGLELIGDPSNAALQYREAGNLLEFLAVDEKSGRLAPRTGTNDTARADATHWSAELVCFVMTGRAPRGENVWKDDLALDGAGYAEIYAGERLLGRSYALSDTMDLAFTTEQKEMAKKLVKTVARVAMKETIAVQIEQNNELLGSLVRLVLIGLLENPDTRRWETLPRYLQVARVPCPTDLKSFTVVYRSSSGLEQHRQEIVAPLQRRGNLFVSFCRDLPPVPTHVSP
jgi:tetratricopeptide (TPR) repeat protein